MAASAHVEARKQRKRKHWRWSAYLSGAFFLLVLSFPTAEEQEDGGAAAAGALAGALVVPLGIAVLLRLAYVKLVRRDGRRVWSPWIFALAVPLAMLARAGTLSSEN